MSWTKLTLPVRSRPSGILVRIGPLKSKSKHPRLQIRIPSSVAIEAWSTAKPDRADVFHGSGADSGKLQIAQNAHGEFAFRDQSKGSMMVVTEPPPGAPSSFPSTEVEDLLIENGAVVFRLPWHVRAGEREISDDDLPTAWDVRGILKPPTNPPPTLDAIEESARPAALPNGRAPSTSEQLKALADQVTEELDKPVNGSAKGHVYADDYARKVEFKHKGKSVQMNKRQHVFASALYKAMRNAEPGSHVPNDVLLRVIDAKELAILTSTGTAVQSLVAPLGLTVGAIRKTGWWMKEG